MRRQDSISQRPVLRTRSLQITASSQLSIGEADGPAAVDMRRCYNATITASENPAEAAFTSPEREYIRRELDHRATDVMAVAFQLVFAQRRMALGGHGHECAQALDEAAVVEAFSGARDRTLSCSRHCDPSQNPTSPHYPGAWQRYTGDLTDDE